MPTTRYPSRSSKFWKKDENTTPVTDPENSSIRVQTSSPSPRFVEPVTRSIATQTTEPATRTIATQTEEPADTSVASQPIIRTPIQEMCRIHVRYTASFRYNGSLEKIALKESSWKPSVGDWVLAVKYEDFEDPDPDDAEDDEDEEDYEEDEWDIPDFDDLRQWAWPGLVIHVHERNKWVRVLMVHSARYLEVIASTFPPEAEGKYLLTDQTEACPWQFLAPWDGREMIYPYCKIERSDLRRGIRTVPVCNLYVLMQHALSRAWWPDSMYAEYGNRPIS